MTMFTPCLCSPLGLASAPHTTLGRTAGHAIGVHHLQRHLGSRRIAGEGDHRQVLASDRRGAALERDGSGDLEAGVVLGHPLPEPAAPVEQHGHNPIRRR